jgi:hypothetical protein
VSKSSSQPKIPPLGAKFGKVLTAVGALITATIGGFCFVNRDEVEWTKRKRYRCFDDAAIALKESGLVPNGWAANALRVLEGARTTVPPGILPDGHPQTVVVKQIFDKLVEANGLQDLDWKIYVLDAPCTFLKPRFASLSSKIL